MLKIGHQVIRPGRKLGDSPVTIQVPEDMETVPGIPSNQREIDWYAREYPLEVHEVNEAAATGWFNAIRNGHLQVRESRKEHQKLNRPLVLACRQSGELPPTSKPTG